MPDADLDALRRLDGVRTAELRGDAIILQCSDSDAAVRALLQAFPEVRDLEITGAGLEAAFLRTDTRPRRRHRAGRPIVNAVYTRYELLRLIRNKRSFIFSLIFPLALFLVIGGSNKNLTLDIGDVSIPFPTYYMVSMAGYGAMIAAISGGARIAAERTVGWNRQLRLTPLKVRDYFTTKVITSYAMAVTSIALLYIAGIAYGVHISPFSRWIEMTFLLLVGILPFVAMGILVGHLLTSDSMGPAVGGGVGVLRLPRRAVVPDPRARRAAHHRPGYAVVLADAGQPHRHRRPGVGRQGLDRRRRVVGGDGLARRLGLPPRLEASLSEGITRRSMIGQRS